MALEVASRLAHSLPPLTVQPVSTPLIPLELMMTLALLPSVPVSEETSRVVQSARITPAVFAVSVMLPPAPGERMSREPPSVVPMRLTVSVTTPLVPLRRSVPPPKAMVEASSSIPVGLAV